MQDGFVFASTPGGLMSSTLSQDEPEFVRAIEDFKKQNSKTFLSWSEVLRIFKDLGYRKSEQQRRKRAARKQKS